MDKEILIYILMGALAILSGPMLADPRVPEKLNESHQTNDGDAQSHKAASFSTSVRRK